MPRSEDIVVTSLMSPADRPCERRVPSLLNGKRGPLILLCGGAYGDLIIIDARVTANMVPEAIDSSSDPFLAHLVLVLSIYDLGPSPSPIPSYDGPSTWQTDNILRSLQTMARRMYTAEDTIASIKASGNWENAPGAKKDHGVGDIPQSSNPSSSDGTTASSFPSTTTHSSSGIPHSSSSPPSFPHNVTSLAADIERNVSAVEELRLLKAQISDVARVCNAVARGDLSQKITVPVQGVVMVQLKDVINGMVDKLGQFAREVTRVSQEVGTEGCVPSSPTRSHHPSLFSP
jgi:osomolarity two-component system sensor histidine kinase NIK1